MESTVGPSKLAGPTLETYVETRFNLLIVLLNEKIHFQDEALKAAVEAQRAAIGAVEATLDASLKAMDLRFQQRFEAQSDALSAAFLAQQTAMQTAFSVAKEAVSAALAAQDRAVLKAELAADKRFESVNEFRQTLDDQQRTLMPRSEVTVLMGGMTDRLAGLKEQVDHIISERIGMKGGYGYAVGVAGFVLTLLSLGVLVWRLVQE